MTPSTLTFLAISVLFISTLTRSTLGFGDALIAMPLLTLVVGIQTATPLVALISTTIAVIITWGNWRNIDMKSAKRLIISSFVGIPFGLLILKTAPDSIITAVLGLLLISFGLYSLFRPALPMLHQTKWAYPFGFVAGVLGGAYNTNGPPLIIYGTLRRWSPSRFRATLQGYFVPSSGLAVIGHGLAGLWTPEIFQLYALTLPLVLVAIFLGGKLNHRIPPGRFERLIYAILIGLGIILLV